MTPERLRHIKEFGDGWTEECVEEIERLQAEVQESKQRTIETATSLQACENEEDRLETLLASTRAELEKLKPFQYQVGIKALEAMQAENTRMRQALQRIWRDVGDNEMAEIARAALGTVSKEAEEK